MAAAQVSDNIHVHGAIYNSQEVLMANGWDFPVVKRVTPGTTKEELKNAVIIAPPSAEGTPWMKKFQPYQVGLCSGWMQVRGNFRRNNVDAGFALSDHADWKGLLSAVKATGAEKVFTTHGFQSAFSRYLNENGIEAVEVKTEFGNEEEADDIKKEEDVNQENNP
jgi:putative mRNA 3-end processing factor